MPEMQGSPGGSGRRRGRPAASAGTATRQRILDAAQRSFGQLGYRGLAVEQLARDLGLDARAIYHYFPSKAALFQAASQAAFEIYGSEVAARVLVHDDLRSRLHAFVALYRSLFVEHRHLLSFISVVVVESVATEQRGDGGDGGGDRPAHVADLATHGAPVVAMNTLLVDQAIDRGELVGEVGAEAAVALLQMVGMGLGLASLGNDPPFLPMLDALDRLIDGTLLSG